MRLASLASLALLLGPGAALAQQAPPHVPAIAPSSYATVAVHVSGWRLGDRWASDPTMGPARIAITYGQPHARGRDVVGTLIPRDTIWRFGANLATTLDTDLALDLGGLHVPRGRYTLYTRYGADGWQLVVSRSLGQVGMYEYDQRQDLGRVPLVARTLTEPRESLGIYLVPDAASTSDRGVLGGVLRIEWGDVELRAPWRVAEGAPQP